jgi:hypothetical protein
LVASIQKCLLHAPTVDAFVVDAGVQPAPDIGPPSVDGTKYFVVTPDRIEDPEAPNFNV